jgi:hypothetical protein
VVLVTDGFRGFDVVLDPAAPPDQALLVSSDALGGVTGLLRLPLDLWPHDGPFWGGTQGSDPVVRAAAREAMLRAEDDLAALLDRTWEGLGWDPAVWRHARATATSRARADRARLSFLIESLYAATILPPESFTVITAT